MLRFRVTRERLPWSALIIGPSEAVVFTYIDKKGDGMTAKRRITFGDGGGRKNHLDVNAGKLKTGLYTMLHLRVDKY